MRTLLRGSLGRSLKSLQAEDKLAAAWTVACGKALAERGTIIGFEGGVLRVEVAEAMWMQQWIVMRSQLAAQVSRIAGVPVRAIDFEMRGSRRDAAWATSPGGWQKRSGGGTIR